MNAPPTPMPTTAGSGAVALRGRARLARLADPQSLSVALAILMGAQAAIGLLVPSVYRDEAWVAAAWFGNDLVTLLVAVPVLAASLVAARRGSVRGRVLWLAMLGYAVYNYGYYLFGASLNVLFPLIVLLFTLPIIALVLAVARLDPSSIAFRMRSAPVGWAVAYLLFTGIGLTVAWLAQWAGYVINGTVPAVGLDAFRLIAAMDLSFMVPPMLVGAALLARRRPWGSVIAPVIILKGATYTLVLTASSLVAGTRGIEGSFEQAPIWAAWTVAGMLAGWTLLRGLDRRPSGPGSTAA